jgi:hypothetical protein
MKRTFVALVVGFVFLVPMTSWSKSNSSDLEARVAQLEAQVAALQATVVALQSQLNNEAIARQQGDVDTLSNAHAYTDSAMPDADDLVQNLGKYVSVDDTADRITFTGVNVQIHNGAGATVINGRGNLIVGYDHERGGYPPVCSLGLYLTEADCTGAGYVWAVNHKSGSHNLIVGEGHNYSSYGGFVAGQLNTVNRVSATVSGGVLNEASGDYSSVSGGYENKAISWLSSVSGGQKNTAAGGGERLSAGVTAIPPMAGTPLSLGVTATMPPTRTPP